LDDQFDETFSVLESVLRTGEPAVASTFRSDLPAAKRRSSSELTKNARAGVPLKAEGRVVGLLYVDGREKQGVFSDLDLEILEALADHAALLIGPIRLETPIRELLGVDATTLPAAGSRSFLEELDRRVGDVVRASARQSFETA